MIAQGHCRVTPHSHPEAVQWWFFITDGEWSFARGGACQTTREARRLIRRSLAEAAEAKKKVLERPRATLRNDGELEPVAYSPFEGIPG